MSLSDKIKIVDQVTLIENWNAFAQLARNNNPTIPVLAQDGVCYGLSLVFAEYNHKNEKEKFIDLVRKASVARYRRPDEETIKFIKRVAKLQERQIYIPKKSDFNPLKKKNQHTLVVIGSEDISKLITPLQAGESAVLYFFSHEIYVGRELDGSITVYDPNEDAIRNFKRDLSVSRFILERIRDTRNRTFFEEITSFLSSLFASHIKQDYLSTPTILNFKILATDFEDEDLIQEKDLFLDEDHVNRALTIRAICEFNNDLIRAQFDSPSYDEYDLNRNWEVQTSSGFRLGPSPMECALYRHNLDAAEFFIEKGAESSLLLDAAFLSNDHFNLAVKYFPEALDLKNSYGATILHDAILNNKVEMVETLLELGANYQKARIDIQQQTLRAWKPVLLKADYKPYDDLTPVKLAEKLGRTEILDIIERFDNERGGSYSQLGKKHPTHEKIIKIESREILLKPSEGEYNPYDRPSPRIQNVSDDKQKPLLSFV